MWAGYRPRSIRTTNACEGVNAKLNGMFCHKHPHIFLVLDAFLEVQDFSYIQMRSQPSNHGDVNETFLEDQFTQLREGKISRFQFVKSVSRKFLPTKINFAK